MMSAVGYIPCRKNGQHGLSSVDLWLRTMIVVSPDSFRVRIAEASFASGLAGAVGNFPLKAPATSTVYRYDKHV